MKQCNVEYKQYSITVQQTTLTHDKMEYSDTIMNQIQALNKEFKGMSMSSSK